MQLHREYKDQGLDVILLNLEGKEGLEAARTVVQKLSLNVTNLCLAEAMTEAGLAAAQMETADLPAIHVFDREGKLHSRFIGLFDHDELKQSVSELLAQ